MLGKTPETTIKAAAGNTAHPFDRATQVAAVEGRWRGTASEDYFAFVGPFGGVTAATMLRVIMAQPECAGDPLTVTVNLCAPVARGTFDLAVRPMKATRSTRHWMVELSQDGEVAAFMTAVFAVRRPSWSHQPATMPSAPLFDSIEPLPDSGVTPWVKQYQFRFVEGTPSYGNAPRETLGSAYSRMWLSDAPSRRIDALSLLSMCDTFFARIFHVRGEIVPIGTVTMTTMFHADAADLAEERTTMVLGAADARRFHKGFSDQTGELWSPGGRLLATTSQTVYFKA
ncbi:MAG: thioesterase family protein [Candidatus Afipia apatlaquensis]|uniref:Thioesterase family protein n=1 Tax=Candidatus Afipia apatlaquensis TaxID=2712852 RepID=A0A7C9VFV1_9BRAD|nr:thioesterase family protein [Candidatus Afipia apatlaquensis]